MERDVEVRILGNETECIVSMRKEANLLISRLKVLYQGAVEAIEDDLETADKADNEFEELGGDLISSYLSIQELGKLWQAEVQGVLLSFPVHIVERVRKVLEKNKAFQEIKDVVRDREQKNRVFEERVNDLLQDLEQRTEASTH
jgi:DNA integrity scanning protein DisA with diadenylate cyclase activity